jgi:hypothetical protein
MRVAGLCCDGHSPTDTVRVSYVTAVAVAAGQSKQLYSGVGTFNWYYLSFPPQIPRPPWFGLEWR